MGVRGEKKWSSFSTESCVVFDQTGNSGSRWAYPYSVTCQYEQPLMWDIFKGFCQQRCTDVGVSFMLMTRSWIVVISWDSVLFKELHKMAVDDVLCHLTINKQRSPHRYTIHRLALVPLLKYWLDICWLPRCLQDFGECWCNCTSQKLCENLNWARLRSLTEASVHPSGQLKCMVFIGYYYQGMLCLKLGVTMCVGVVHLCRGVKPRP